MSTAMLAAISARQLNLAFFVQATFASGPIYVWSGLGPIVWNGQTWQGLGSLGSISAIEEGGTVDAKGLTLSLSGIDATLLSLVLGEFVLTLPVFVYLALFDENVLIDIPITSFAGRMDQPVIEIDGKTAVISINCESRLLDMNIAVDRRYTMEDQQRDWPGDLGFFAVASIQEMSLYWGTSPSSATNL